MNNKILLQFWWLKSVLLLNSHAIANADINIYIYKEEKEKERKQIINKKDKRKKELKKKRQKMGKKSRKNLVRYNQVQVFISSSRSGFGLSGDWLKNRYGPRFAFFDGADRTSGSGGGGGGRGGGCFMEEWGLFTYSFFLFFALCRAERIQSNVVVFFQ